VLNHEVTPSNSTGEEKSFIEDQVASFDYCHNPGLAQQVSRLVSVPDENVEVAVCVQQHGTLIVNARRGSVMIPVISYCKVSVSVFSLEDDLNLYPRTDIAQH
jgi:hypothetical protein